MIRAVLTWNEAPALANAVFKAASKSSDDASSTAETASAEERVRIKYLEKVGEGMAESNNVRRLTQL